MGGSAKIGIVGALNSFIQNMRQKGFEDTVKSNPDVTVAGVVDGRNIQDNALAAAENLITGNPDLTAVYATGEPALLGAVAAVESAGRDRPGQGLRLGPDRAGDQGHRRRLRRRRRPAGPGGMGAAAVESALTLINGGTVDPVIPVPMTIVTKENVEPVPRHVPVTGIAHAAGALGPTATARPCPASACAASASRSAASRRCAGSISTSGRARCLGLVGDNAAGKSTLTKILAGAYCRTPARSSSTAGRCASPARPKRAPGGSRWSIRTCRSATRSTSPATCSSAASRRGTSSACGCSTSRGCSSEARATLDALDIHIPNLKALVAQLSGGQRQSIAIGRAAPSSRRC